MAHSRFKKHFFFLSPTTLRLQIQSCFQTANPNQNQGGSKTPNLINVPWSRRKSRPDSKSQPELPFRSPPLKVTPSFPFSLRKENERRNMERGGGGRSPSGNKNALPKLEHMKAANSSHKEGKGEGGRVGEGRGRSWKALSTISRTRG